MRGSRRCGCVADSLNGRWPVTPSPGWPATGLSAGARSLALWRGPPLADVPWERFADGDVRRWEELRLATHEDLVDAELAAGKHAVPPLVRPQWPVMVQDDSGSPVDNGTFMVSHASREEKGSDVNIASHMLVDALTGQVDATVLISNDSDLRFPVEFIRQHVPVGVVNPSPNRMAGALQGQRDDGVGRHWWYQLTEADLRAHQLPDPSGHFRRPDGW